MIARALRCLSLHVTVLGVACLTLACGAEITILGAPGGESGGGTATGHDGGSGVGGHATGAGGIGASGTGVGGTGAGGTGVGGTGAGGTGAGGTGAGGTGGGPSGLCGGDSGQSCGPIEFCDWPDDSCGLDGTPGHCMLRPHTCDDDCPGVCGCSGLLYCNECTAHRMGIDVSTSVDCAGASTEYKATFHSTGGHHELRIWKIDTFRDICILLQTHSELPDTQDAPGFDFTMPPHYSVLSARVTSPATCGWTPWSDSLYAASTGGVGVVDWDQWFCPAQVTFDAVLYFDATEPWIPSVEVLSASAIPVEGCEPWP